MTGCDVACEAPPLVTPGDIYAGGDDVTCPGLTMANDGDDITTPCLVMNWSLCAVCAVCACVDVSAWLCVRVSEPG